MIHRNNVKIVTAFVIVLGLILGVFAYNIVFNRGSIRSYDLKSLIGFTTIGVIDYSDLNNDKQEEAIIRAAEGAQGVRLYIIAFKHNKPQILYDQIIGYAIVEISNKKVIYKLPNKDVNKNKPASDWTFTDIHSIEWDGSKFVSE